MYKPAAETRLPAGAASRRKLLAQVWATKTPEPAIANPKAAIHKEGTSVRPTPIMHEAMAVINPCRSPTRAKNVPAISVVTSPQR